MTTKQWIVSALLRLYPAAWRSEYGPELTGILLARPLGPRVIADVLWNGFRQRAQAAEPSTILGLAAMLVILTGFVLTGNYGRNWTAVLQPSARTFPPVAVTFLASELFVYLLIACGCWTHLRYGGKVRRAGVAAMRMALIASMPVMLAALLMMSGLLELRFGGPRLLAPSPWAILISPLARLPEFWIWGALGGQLGKWITRRRHRAGAIQP
jgi:hypothetical protein